MIFLFHFVGLIAAHKLSISSSQLTNYEKKLRKYQNMTNIDEATFQEIWTAGLKSCKFSLFDNESN